ncbi:DUF1707 SHOCT-like domain-containing protein [Nocardioides sp. GXQ0305]|uniref:DUF1707 SHOCT-like domain-containing protein n=1 Tax=Nocardioides sp. GXQ0305 TaxID=3423912 RepID=UPI003D7C5E4B
MTSRPSHPQSWQPRNTWQQQRPELRIGDAERDRAASQLAEHYAAGRITQEEHAERLDRIWAAKTRSELDPVFADLPGHATDPGPRPAGPRPGPRRRNRPPLLLVVLLVVIAGALVLANLPLVLIGLGVWFFFLRGSCGSRASSWRHGTRRW